MAGRNLASGSDAAALPNNPKNPRLVKFIYPPYLLCDQL